MEAWPFLVSRNRSIGYTTIVAPSIWIERHIANSLANIAGGELTEEGTAIYREVFGTDIGDFSLVFRVIDAVDGNERFIDGFGRLIEWIEGIVIPGRDNQEYVQWADMESVHKVIFPIYLDFWEKLVAPPIVSSKKINLSTDCSSGFPSSQLILRTVKPFIFGQNKKMASVLDEEYSQSATSKIDSKRQRTEMWNVVASYDFRYPVEDLYYNTEFEEIVIIGGKASYAGFINPCLKNYFKIRLLNETSTGALAVSPIGDHIAIAVNYKLKSQQSEIILWERKSEQNRKCLTSAGLSDISCLAYNNDASLIVCGTNTGKVFVWSKKENSFVGKPIKYEFGIKEASFTPDGNVLVLHTEKNIITLQVSNHRLSDTQTVSEKGRFTKFSIHPNSKFIAASSYNSKIYIYDISSEKNVDIIDMNFNDINVLCYSPNGEILSVGGSMGIGLFDFESHSVTLLQKKHKDSVTSLLFITNSSLFSGGKDKKIIHWSNQNTYTRSGGFSDIA